VAAPFGCLGFRALSRILQGRMTGTCYRVLARKLPALKPFTDLVGQDAMVRTLKRVRGRSRIAAGVSFMDGNPRGPAKTIHGKNHAGVELPSGRTGNGGHERTSAGVCDTASPFMEGATVGRDGRCDCRIEHRRRQHRGDH